MQKNVINKWKYLLNDKNATVRKTACIAFESFVRKVFQGKDKMTTTAVMGMICEFKQSQNYKDRICFIHITANMIKNNFTLFESNFLIDYVDLSFDKVKNVKIVLGSYLFEKAF